MTQHRPNTSDYRRLFLERLPLLDVRAPVEFNRGAFPTSCNLPLVNDDERCQIGTRYKESGHQAAVELGHQLVQGEQKEKRLAAWRDFVSRCPHGYLYCFRGGERSHIAQSWLAASGFDYPLVTGGYKAMRTFLLEELQRSVAACQFTVVSGKTGTGKTRFLAQFDHVIDLEKLANHRGSAFGRRMEGQPSQIDFENRLAIALLQACQADSPHVLIEDESKLIGHCYVPDILRDKMARSPVLLLQESLDRRVQTIYEEYIEHNRTEAIARLGAEGNSTFARNLVASLDCLRKRLGGLRHQQLRETMLQALANDDDNISRTLHCRWIRTLLSDYYDPMYEFQLATKKARIVASGERALLRAAVHARPHFQANACTEEPVQV